MPWPNAKQTRVVFTRTPCSKAALPSQRAESVSQGFNYSAWFNFLNLRNHLFPVLSLCTLTGSCCHSSTFLFWSCSSLGGWLRCCGRDSLEHTAALWAMYAWLHSLIGIKAEWPHVETREVHRGEHEKGNYDKAQLCGCVHAWVSRASAWKEIMYSLCNGWTTTIISFLKNLKIFYWSYLPIYEQTYI